MRISSILLLPLACGALVVPRGYHRKRQQNISPEIIAAIKANVVDAHELLPGASLAPVALISTPWSPDYSGNRYHHPAVSLSPVSRATTINSEAYQKLTRLLPSVLTHAVAITDKSWELGALVQALLEVYNPELTPFGYNAGSFSISIPWDAMKVAISSLYAVDWHGAPSTSNTTGDIGKFLDYSSPVPLQARPLVGGDGSLGDPAALGPSTYLLAQFAGRDDVKRLLNMRAKEDYAWAVGNQMAYLNNGQKSSNGTISQREDHFELWADEGYMVPPLPACEFDIMARC